MSAETARVRTTELTIGYDGHQVLGDVNLLIPDGQITALIGANGCGKSTLLRTIGRILPAAAGAVLVDGKAVTAHRRRDLARILTLLPQDPIAPDGLTVRELCRFGRDPHRRFGGRLTAEDEAIVDTALEDAGLGDLGHRLIDELSGGQRQRAWIAMALAQQTPVMLLDEPTTYLDIAHQMEVLRLLRRLNIDQGRTIVMVLHDLNQAARFSHHLVAVAHGGIAAAGPAHEVLTEDLVAEVFGIQCAVVSHPLDGSPLCLPRD